MNTLKNIVDIKAAMPAWQVVYGDARWRHSVWHYDGRQWNHMGRQDGTGFQAPSDAFAFARQFTNTKDIFVLSTEPHEALARLDDGDRLPINKSL